MKRIRREPLLMESDYRAGSQVKHPAYGEGTLVGFDEKTGKPYVFFYDLQKVMRVKDDTVKPVFRTVADVGGDVWMKTMEHFGYTPDNEIWTRLLDSHDGTARMAKTLWNLVDWDKKFRATLDYDPEFPYQLIRVNADGCLQDF